MRVVVCILGYLDVRIFRLTNSINTGMLTKPIAYSSL